MGDTALVILAVLLLVALIIMSTGGMAVVMSLKMGSRPTDHQRQVFDTMLTIFRTGAGSVITMLSKLAGPRIGAGRQGGEPPGRIGEGRQRPPARRLEGPRADDRPDDPCSPCCERERPARKRQPETPVFKRK